MSAEANSSKCRKVVMRLGVLLAFTLHAPDSNAAKVSSGLLAEGTGSATPWWSIDSEVAGPTVLVVGGLHGNEPAGSWAAQQIVHWPIVRGKLVVVPRVNRLGLEADMRWVPAFRNDRKLRDLNRNFPRKDRREAVTPIGRALWAFVAEQKPDWVFDLHEGFDFHRQNPKSVGSSVIAFPEGAEFAKMLQAAANVGVPKERRFVLLAKNGSAQGSLARACTEQLGAKAFVLETTFKEQPVSLRTRQHRRMMSAALQKIGLTDRDCADLLAPPPFPGQTRVAVFDDAGANEAKVMAVLDGEDDLFISHFGPADARPEVLSQFEVLVFPGGSGSKQGAALGDAGRDAVRGFAREGGGVLGICAGAYLCSSHYSWSLDLMNATVFNKTVEIPGVGRKSMWYRGPPADVEVEVAAEGEGILGISGRHKIRYHNGPILSPGDDPDAPAYRTLAVFRSENGKYEPQKGTMVGAPAVVVSEFGKGRVMAISPHFETTEGKREVVLKALDYLRRRHGG